MGNPADRSDSHHEAQFDIVPDRSPRSTRIDHARLAPCSTGIYLTRFRTQGSQRGCAATKRSEVREQRSEKPRMHTDEHGCGGVVTEGNLRQNARFCEIMARNPDWCAGIAASRSPKPCPPSLQAWSFVPFLPHPCLPSFPSVQVPSFLRALCGLLCK